MKIRQANSRIHVRTGVVGPLFADTKEQQCHAGHARHEAAQQRNDGDRELCGGETATKERVIRRRAKPKETHSAIPF